MSKLLSILVAALFAVSTGSAFAAKHMAAPAEKSEVSKEAKPAEAKPAAEKKAKKSKKSKKTKTAKNDKKAATEAAPKEEAKK
jgi:hypothetical protein